MKPTGKIKTRKILFWLGLTLPMAALLVMTWLVHQSGGQFNHSFNWVMQTYKVQDLFDQTQANLMDAEANQRGFLLTGRREYLEPYQQAMQSIRAGVAELKNLTADSRAQQANLSKLEQMVDEDLVFDPAKAFPAGQTPSSAAMVALTERGKQSMENMRRVLSRAQEEQKAGLLKYQQEAEAEVLTSQITSLVLIASVALALILVVVILLRLERLQKFITVCAWTGQVKFQGQWVRLDEYLEKQFGITVSHTLSQQAAEKMMQEVEELKRAKGGPPSS